MFNSALLDLVLGLAFIYLLLSLTCSVLTEIISGICRWRATVLRDSILQMLGPDLTERLYEHPLILSLSHRTQKGKRSGWDRLSNRLSKLEKNKPFSLSPTYKYVNSVLQGTYEYVAPRLPSYIPPSLFALSLLDLLTEKPATKELLSDAEVRTRLQSVTNDEFTPRNKTEEKEHNSPVRAAQAIVILTDDAVPVAPDDLTQAAERQRLAAYARALGQPLSFFEAAVISQLPPPHAHPAASCIEQWFGYVVERAAGSYKRRSQVTIFVLAAMICWAAQINTLRIGRILWTDSLRRSTLAKTTEQIASQQAKLLMADPQPNPKTVQKNVTDLTSTLNQAVDTAIPFPIGWDSSSNPADKPVTGFASVINLTVGTLISVIAALLGAPFWFDFINRFSNLRSGGTAPAPTKSPVPSTTPPTPSSTTATRTAASRKIPSGS